MKLYKYDFKLLNNDKGIITYKDKTPVQMVDIINAHLREKFDASDDLHISINTIYNLMGERTSSKFLKIFIKEIVKKNVNKEGEILNVLEYK